ncbi:hypothetical protein A2368_01530 [Candidatus Collierbacteria bacterium RIFOXYB1_FULL_49_13]|uniref:Uncharacterized protein n=1 Tax=Candidatus Collierbacteria bacterium RIFOXYB1_FULL_49_13 TaxID=1817728 RepID=A0A1F5FGS8_9BACT|nr:MAG: hypothetical protein A2368_01530 [Candidatus Collierbacteria bacterium RIFOXYB1_FULL_49_13]
MISNPAIGSKFTIGLGIDGVSRYRDGNGGEFNRNNCGGFPVLMDSEKAKPEPIFEDRKEHRGTYTLTGSEIIGYSAVPANYKMALYTEGAVAKLLLGSLSAALPTKTLYCVTSIMPSTTIIADMTSSLGANAALISGKKLRFTIATGGAGAAGTIVVTGYTVETGAEVVETIPVTAAGVLYSAYHYGITGHLGISALTTTVLSTWTTPTLVIDEVNAVDHVQTDGDDCWTFSAEENITPHAYFRNDGLKPTTISISMEPKKTAEVSVSFTGKQSVAISAADTLTYPTMAKFPFNRFKFYTGATLATVAEDQTVQSFNYSRTREGADSDTVQPGDSYIADIVCDELSAKITVNRIFNSTSYTEWQNKDNGTVRAIKLTFIGDLIISGYYQSYTIELPAVRCRTGNIRPGGFGKVIVPFEYVAEYDTTNAFMIRETSRNSSWATFGWIDMIKNGGAEYSTDATNAADWTAVEQTEATRSSTYAQSGTYSLYVKDDNAAAFEYIYQRISTNNDNVTATAMRNCIVRLRGYCRDSAGSQNISFVLSDGTETSKTIVCTAAFVESTLYAAIGRSVTTVDIILAGGSWGSGVATTGYGWIDNFQASILI